MKKKIIIASIITFVLLAVCAVAYQQPRFRCDRCTTQVILLRGGYRTWGVNYCYGFDFDKDGKERHHYHRPEFFHVDVRYLQLPERANYYLLQQRKPSSIKYLAELEKGAENDRASRTNSTNFDVGTLARAYPSITNFLD